MPTVPSSVTSSIHISLATVGGSELEQELTVCSAKLQPKPRHLVPKDCGFVAVKLLQRASALLVITIWSKEALHML